MTIRDKVWSVVLTTALALPLAGPSFAVEPAEGLTITTADGQHSITFAGRFQLRYVVELQDYAPQHNSFFLRRLQPQVDGAAFGGALTFRIKPDIARGAELQDAWVAYDFFDGLQIQGGQYQVPFNWEREVSSNRHQFIERSVANSQFQAATGRDIGLMVHGVLFDRLRYGVGIFNNQGINAPRSDTTGHLYSGRVSYAIAGSSPRTEVLVSPAEELTLAVGVGAYLTTENTARVWDQWYESDTIEATAVATTTDLHLQIARLSIHVAGFYWDVVPFEDTEDAMPDYQGYGFAAHAGILLIPERLFIALRYSEARPNIDEIATSRREALLGLQVFHQGQDSKVHVEAGRIERHDDDDWQDEQIFRMQYQFLF
ncbi:MAG: porin [Bradymonadaceae bacterium]